MRNPGVFAAPGLFGDTDGPRLTKIVIAIELASNISGVRPPVAAERSLP
jgi:hypothetical protein